MISKLKISASSFIIGVVVGMVALSLYVPKEKIDVKKIDKPVNEWKEHPKNADCDTLRKWALSPIVLSYELGTMNNGMTPIYVTGTDGNKTTRETWGITTTRPELKHFGASIMISPRKNIYGIATYNTGMIYISAGACVPIGNISELNRYDVFGGVGMWF